jgi:uncharacterized protein (DUF1330 family)
MLLLVQIDLSEADLAAFDAYEATVQPLMARYGGRVSHAWRALDERSETHIVSFPDEAAASAYRSDPDRAAAQPLWEASGARSTVTLVRALD